MEDVISLHRVKAYKDYYVTKNGDVYRKWHSSFKKLNPYNTCGYPTISICLGNKKYIKVYVHRLIAETFLPNEDGKPFVDHINTNTEDNRVENLRWVTQKENCNNKTSKGHYLISNTLNAMKRFKYSSDIIPVEIKKIDGLSDCLREMKKGVVYSIGYDIAQTKNIRHACTHVKFYDGYRFQTLNMECEKRTLIRRIS